MTVVVLAQPRLAAAPPPPPVEPFHGLDLRWIGVDGSVWNLLDWRSGVFITRDGLEGLHTPEWQRYTSQAVGVPGQRSRGYREEARNVEWPIYMYAGSSAEYEALEAAWFRSLHPDIDGTWQVTTPTGRTRSLQCKWTSDGGYTHDHDPVKFGWCRYSVSLVADDPFWYGEPVSTGWAAPVSVGMYTDGWVTVVSNGSADGATLTNPGDVDAWVQWTVTTDSDGSVSSGELTVAGGSIGVPAMTAGQTLVIDTDPTVGTGFLDGSDVSGDVDPWDPRPVPGHATVDVGISLSGSGWTVEARFPARHWRAL